MLHTIFPNVAAAPRIVVPQGTLGSDAPDWALVQAVVNWVNAMQEHGCYGLAEMPEAGPMAYFADYYFAQVCNGGHAQFRHNSSMAEATVDKALAGLRAAGLGELAGCLTDLRSGAAPLEALDARFMAARESYQPAMRRWLAVHVEGVPDGDYPLRMEAQMARDAERERRYLDRRLLRLQALSEDEMRMALGLCALRARLMFRRVSPGSFHRVLGHEVVAWGVVVTDGAAEKVLRGARMGGATWLLPAMPKGAIDDPDDLRSLVKGAPRALDAEVAAEAERARAARIGARLALLLDAAPRLDPGMVTSVLPAPALPGADGSRGWIVILADGTGRVVLESERDLNLIDAEGAREASLPLRRVERELAALDARLLAASEAA